MRYLILLLVTIALFGCGDSSNSTDNPDASPIVIPWVQHDAFYGIFSTAFYSGAVGDELIVQLAYGLAKVDLENHAAIYSSFNTPDITRYAGVIGNPYFAETYNTYKVIGFRYLPDLFNNKENLALVYSLEGEDWLTHVPYPAHVVEPMFNSGSGPAPFGVFNDHGQLATIVYTQENTTCYAVVMESVPSPVDLFKELVVKSVTELANPCYNGGDDASYASDGTNFYIGSITNDAYMLTPEGAISKIYDGRVTNLFYQQNGTLLLQSDYDLLVSYDYGKSWTNIWNNTPFYRLMMFEANNTIYTIDDKKIYQLVIDGTDIVVSEIDNTGIADNTSNISSLAEFNGRMYLTTIGEGVFYKNIDDL